MIDTISAVVDVWGFALDHRSPRTPVPRLSPTLLRGVSSSVDISVCRGEPAIAYDWNFSLKRGLHSLPAYKDYGTIRAPHFAPIIQLHDIIRPTTESMPQHSTLKIKFPQQTTRRRLLQKHECKLKLIKPSTRPTFHQLPHRNWTPFHQLRH